MLEPTVRNLVVPPVNSPHSSPHTHLVGMPENLTRSLKLRILTLLFRDCYIATARPHRAIEEVRS